MKIKPLITSLPFYRVKQDGYFSGTTGQEPFYFQKKQCERDCFFGTITDKNSLPPFIIRFPKLDGLDYSSEFTFGTFCEDSLNKT